MHQRTQDVVLTAALLLAFPGALHLTHHASSEPGSPGQPSQRPPAPASVSAGG